MSISTSDWNRIFHILDNAKTQRQLADEYRISQAWISIKYKEYLKKKLGGKTKS